MGIPRKPLYLKLVDSLLELHRKQASAVVRLESGSAKKQFVIRAGRLAFAESNHPDEHLARVMMGLKMIRSTDFPRITAAMKAGKPTDEAILTTCGLTTNSIETGAREQALTILASLFPWREHKLHVYPGEAFNLRLVNLQASVPEIILGAVRRATAQQKLPDPFKSPKGKIVPVDQGMAGRLEIPLDKSESYAYSLISGPTAIEDVALLLASTGAQPARVIQHLLLLGLVRIQEQQASAAETREREEASGSKALAEKVESLLRSFEVATLYEILSVPPDADVDQIKTAYYELARQYHPDRFQSDQHSAEFRAMIEKLFTHITGAYAKLSDPAARLAYDETRLKQDSPVEAALQSQASPDAGNEKMAETLFRAARLALVGHDYQKAAAQLSECVWLCPDCAKYHHFLGVAQSEIPRFRKEAETHLLKAIESNASAIESRMALGKLYMKVNLSRRAKAQFEEVLRWDPDNPEAQKMLASSAK